MVMKGITVESLSALPWTALVSGVETGVAWSEPCVSAALVSEVETSCEISFLGTASAVTILSWLLTYMGGTREVASVLKLPTVVGFTEDESPMVTKEITCES